MWDIGPYAQARWCNTISPSSINERRAGPAIIRYLIGCDQAVVFSLTERHSHADPSVLPDQIPVPGAPQMLPIPLPSSTTTTSITTSTHSGDGIFPLDIYSRPTIPTLIKLHTIFLKSPVHIHTPGMHIGIICGNFTGQRLSALDLVFFLQAFASHRIDCDLTYSRLPSGTNVTIEAVFTLRNGHALSAAQIWETFVSGQNPSEGPTGDDLLLGNNKIWGFESDSFGGYSVVHIAQ